MLLNLSVKPVLIYYSETVEEYVFLVQYLDITTLDVMGEIIPSTSVSDVVSHMVGGARELEEAMPREIPAGWVFPTTSLLGSFTTSILSRFDRIEGFPLVPIHRYSTAQLVSAFFPMCMTDIYAHYIKDGNPLTPTPPTLTGRTLFPLPSGATMFLPLSDWLSGWKTLTRSYDSGLEQYFYTASWMYSYGDIPDPTNQVVLNPDGYIYSSQHGYGCYRQYGTLQNTLPVALPVWDGEGELPEPMYGDHTAWRYTKDYGYMDHREMFAVCPPDYPMIIHPRKTDFPPQEGSPELYDSDDVSPYPLSEEFVSSGFVFRPTFGPTNLITLTGLKCRTALWPTLFHSFLDA